MKSKKYLGVYFGGNSLSIVECEKQKIVNFFDASSGLLDEKDSPSKNSAADDIRLIALIQRTIRDKGIYTTEASLSLPTKDIILRSFLIPWMTSAEVKGVVEFEARRYIPFKLEDLFYGYHAVTIMENKIRRIRILFVAVKKDIFLKYSSILSQAGLKVVFGEPAPISLLRLLAFKKQITSNQRIAVVQTAAHEGSIIILDRNIIQFVREFSLSTSAADSGMPDQAILNTRLISEVRISLDYFRRQHSVTTIDKLVLLSSHQPKELAENLGKDLGISASALHPDSIVDTGEGSGMGIFYAYGANLRNSFPFPVNIDLSKPPVKSEDPEKIFKDAPVSFVPTFKLAGVLAAVLVAAFFIFGQKTTLEERKLAELRRKESIYSAFAVEDLAFQKDGFRKKLESYKKIPLKSNAALFLSQIPNKLPDGVWLTSFSINTQNTNMGDLNAEKENLSIQLSGFAYAPDSTEAITRIDRLIKELRKDPELSKFFEEITLQSVKKQTLREYPVTRFEIVCK